MNYCGYSQGPNQQLCVGFADLMVDMLNDWKHQHLDECDEDTRDADSKWTAPAANRSCIDSHYVRRSLETEAEKLVNWERSFKGKKGYAMGIRELLSTLSDEHRWLSYDAVAYALVNNFLKDLPARCRRLMGIAEARASLPKNRLFEPLREYLDIAMKNYVDMGDNPSTLALLRSAADEALKHVITDHMYEEVLWHKEQSRKYSFWGRIRIAEHKGLIGKKTSETLNDIRHRGNKSVHGEPCLSRNTEKVVLNTVKAIQEILQIEC